MDQEQKSILLITEWPDPRFLRGVARYARAEGWHLGLDCVYGRGLPWGWKGQYPKSKHFENLSQIDYPEATPMFADCLWVGGWPNRNNSEDPQTYEREQKDGPGSWNSGMSRFAITRHNPNKVNVVLADGHAKTILPSELWMLRWHKESIPDEVDIAWE